MCVCVFVCVRERGSERLKPHPPLVHVTNLFHCVDKRGHSDVSESGECGEEVRGDGESTHPY